MMNRNEILAHAVIDDVYASQPDLRRLLWLHSRAVADMALECAHARNLQLDTDFVEQAALLHDIGIIVTDAPTILCRGAQPYICHGLAGGRILRRRGLPRHARVAERHTGAGLTATDIASQNLPLPHRDFLPETIEERLICYADKFYSKSGNLTLRKPFDRVRAGMLRHGPDTLARFDALHDEFGLCIKRR